VKATRLRACDHSLETVIVEKDFTMSSEVIPFPETIDEHERSLIANGCNFFTAKENLRAAKAISEASKLEFANLKAKVIQNRQTQIKRLIEIAKKVISGGG
jgi:hypothetical protein